MSEAPQPHQPPQPGKPYPSTGGGQFQKAPPPRQQQQQEAESQAWEAGKRPLPPEEPDN